MEVSSYTQIYIYKKYNLSRSFRFNGPGIQFYGNGKIITGENSYIGSYSRIQAGEGTSVIIGNNTAISHYVVIYTMNRVANQNFSKKNIKCVKKDVKVGNNCWIGYRVFIKEGVTIGDNVVIGAGSVVTKDIPSYSIAAGCPARVIKKIDGWKH